MMGKIFLRLLGNVERAVLELMAIICELIVFCIFDLFCSKRTVIQDRKISLFEKSVGSSGLTFSQKMVHRLNTQELQQIVRIFFKILPIRGRQEVLKKSRTKIKKAAELPESFRPLHGLRHVYATMLASSGKVDMYTLQKQMTHKSTQMTQRYAHYRDEAMQRASNEVSGILEDALFKTQTLK
jgi:hypothetical protein